MAYHGTPTTVIGARIPDQLVPKLHQIAADRGVAPATLTKAVLMEFIASQTAKSPQLDS